MDISHECIFKNLIVKQGFVKSVLYRTDWKKQICEIDSYWNRLIRDIPFEIILEDFIIDLRIQNLDIIHFDLYGGFVKSLTCWRIDLMSRVANKIYQNISNESGDYVKWNGNTMEILQGQQ